MIGLDTNLLVRYFTQDDPVQSPIATDVMERRLTQDEPGFVSVVVIAETVWVLDRAYRLGNCRNPRTWNPGVRHFDAIQGSMHRIPR